MGPVSPLKFFKGGQRQTAAGEFSGRREAWLAGSLGSRPSWVLDVPPHTADHTSHVGDRNRASWLELVFYRNVLHL